MPENVPQQLGHEEEGLQAPLPGRLQGLLLCEVRPVFEKLPGEDVEPGDEDKCGRLLMSMHGTRDAAVNWHHEYVNALEGFGMKRGAASPCLFNHSKLDLSVFVRGDDFVAVGPGHAVAMLEGYLKNRYKV